MLDEREKLLAHRSEGIALRCEQTYEMSAGNVISRVTLQLNRHGNPVFRYWFGENRVGRQTFQTLTCSETRCPMRQAMLLRWQIHVGLAKPARHFQQNGLAKGALAIEEWTCIGEHKFTARETRFPVDLNCRQNAHEPIRIGVGG